MHQLGLAFDGAFTDDPRTPEIENELYPKNFQRWKEVADIAEECGIEWMYPKWAKQGFFDKPHFQDMTKKPNFSNEVRMLRACWAILEKTKEYDSKDDSGRNMAILAQGHIHECAEYFRSL